MITSFISEIWNQSQFSKIDSYLHVNYTDHSLPAFLPSTKDGLILWITETGKSFEHKTIIEDMVCEANKVVIKIKIEMKHIGEWRGIKPTGKEVFAPGYRYYKIADEKIIEHWALIDGTSIEDQIREISHGCKL